MSINKDSWLYKNFEWDWPLMAKEVVDATEGWHELIITTRDGRKYSYYEIDKTITEISDGEFTEADCRRIFGTKLRRVLELKQMNQDELAEALELNSMTISRYITGKTTPNIYQVHRIAKVLGCSVKDLIYEE